MLIMLITSVAIASYGQIGKRPYEMVWADRVEDDHPPLIDFEDLSGWRVEVKNSEAVFEQTREQQIWGKYVGKFTYKATGENPEVRILPPEPVDIKDPFDALTCWIYGNNWAWAPDPNTPQVNVSAIFEDSQGRDIWVNLIRVRWKEWFLCHKRLTPEEIQQVKSGAKFKAFIVDN
ncbi:hypothetical protein GF312_05430, partial [Candidatus Poribacteria bacterium]|nr:hypothetical protein [Candidatus Poribacteria bacterium]